MSGLDMNNLQAMLAQAASQKPLLEFKAGICHQNRTTVSPDVRKGKVVLMQNEDGLLKFQWRLRPSDAVEIDLTILPGGATYEKVNAAGRVYLLRIVGSDNKRFFWMQEPSAEKDDEISKKIAELIANPPPPPENNIESMMAGMDEKQQHQLMNMLSHGTAGPAPGSRGSAGSSGRPAASAGAAGAGAGASNPSAASLAASLTEMVQRLMQQGAGGAGAGAAGGAQGAAGRGGLNAGDFLGPQLSDVLDTRRTVPLVDDSIVREVADYLPPQQRSRADVVAHLQSPQLQQTLDRMSSLLNSSQYGNLMSSLGLSHTGDIGVNGFLRAIEQEAKRSTPAAGAGSTAGATSTTPAASSTTAPAATSTQNPTNPDSGSEKKDGASS